MLWWNWKLETCSGAAFNKHSIFFTDLSHCTTSLPPWLVKGKTCPFQKRRNSHERMLAAQIRPNNVYYLLFRAQLIFHLHQCIQSRVDLCFTSGFNPWMPFVGYCGQCWKLWSHLMPLVWVWVCPGITIVLTGSGGRHTMAGVRRHIGAIHMSCDSHSLTWFCFRDLDVR